MGHIPIRINIDAIHVTESAVLASTKVYDYEDLFFYCKNGGIIQDIVLKEDNRQINLIKRFYFYKVQKELGITEVDAILNYQDNDFFEELLKNKTIQVRDLKTLIEKESMQSKNESLEAYFFEEELTESKKEKLKVCINNFLHLEINKVYPSQNIEYRDFKFLESLNCLKYLANIPFHFDDKNVKISYNFFLQKVNSIAKLRSVNGRLYKSPNFIIPQTQKGAAPY